MHVRDTTQDRACLITPYARKYYVGINQHDFSVWCRGPATMFLR